MTIEEMQPADWPACARIYEEGMEVGTFETDVPSWDRWDETHLISPRLVARENGSILGWAALTPFSSRRVYRGVAEDSVYVGWAARGRGVGRALLQELVRRAEEDGIWTVQAGILDGNAGSVALHAACGFRVVGTRERIAQKHGVWHDVVLMERRSSVV